MTGTSNANFAAEVMRLAEPIGEFKPVATYDPDGDCIEFLAKPDAFYAERVDDLVTVYYSQETNQVIGSLIKGVHGFMAQHPGLKVDIQDGRMRLVHLFRAKVWNKTNPQSVEVRTYRKLIEVAQEASVEADLVGV